MEANITSCNATNNKDEFTEKENSLEEEDPLMIKCEAEIKEVQMKAEVTHKDGKMNNQVYEGRDAQYVEVKLEESDQYFNVNHIDYNCEEIVIKEEYSIQDDSNDMKTENDECNYNLTSMPNYYPFLEEPHKKEDNICHQDDCNPENIVNESDYFQVTISSKSTLGTNNPIFLLSDHDQIEIDAKPHNIYSSKSCTARSFLNEGKNMDNAESILKEDKNMDPKKPYKCKYCTKSFTRKNHLNSHEGIHIGDRPYKCIHCLKSYTQSSHLKTHERSHTGEERFKCKYCTKSCNRKSDLIVHERVHTGEKPYKCNHCTKPFRTSTQLMIHERIHTGEKPYTCNYCTKLFARRNLLKEHERTHTGEKPYKCNYCKKSFTARGNLKVHRKIHTGEKPYKCKYCTKAVVRRNELIVHERTHSGEAPYKCNYCSKSFTQSCSLRRHKSIHC